MDYENPDIVGIGICTVDHLLSVPKMPLDNETIRAKDYLRQCGGLASAAMVAAARLGAKAKIIARIGDDEDGQYIREDFDKEGVDTSKLMIEPGSQSHTSVILVNENTGDRSIITRWATGAPISPQEFTRDDITSAKVLFVDNVTDATRQAVRWANEAGLHIVIDPARPYEIMKAILPDVTVPIVSEHFASEWMPDAPPEAAAQALYDMGATIAIVTLGARGSVVCSDAGVQAFPTFPVEVVDTTGAGDAFHGAFMVALLHEEWSLEQKVRFAAAVGAMNCRAMGGRTGLPTRAEVDAFLAAQ